MAYVETHRDMFQYGLHQCRLKYAAFLYDEYRKQHSHSKAIALAAQQASVAGYVLRDYLPRHNHLKRVLRNQTIIDMRASGYSINMIADNIGVHRCTVSRVLDTHKSRANAARRYDRHKIRGRLKYGDPRLEPGAMVM